MALKDWTPNKKISNTTRNEAKYSHLPPTYESTMAIFNKFCQYINEVWPDGLVDVLRKKRPDIWRWLSSIDERVNPFLFALRKSSNREIFDRFVREADRWKRGIEKAINLYNQSKLENR